MTRSLLPLFLIASLAFGLGCAESKLPIAVGTLERHRIELRAERQEPILRLAVKEGDSVKAGEILLELDSRRVRALLSQAEATRDLAAARLAEVVRGFRYEEIDQARAQLAEAEAAVVQIEPDLARLRVLVPEGAESQSSLDALEAGHTAAEARRNAARSTLEKYLNGATAEELDQAESEVERGEADVQKLSVDVARMVVKAPRDGKIEALPFRVGDEPPVGAPVVVMLADGVPFARVYVAAEVRPLAIPGASVRVEVDGYPDPFEGRLRFVSSEAAFTPYFALTERDRGHFTYLTEIDLVGDSAGDLPTGIPVEVSF